MKYEKQQGFKESIMDHADPFLRDHIIPPG
jgi:hypothetical protein